MHVYMMNECIHIYIYITDEMPASVAQSNARPATFFR